MKILIYGLGGVGGFIGTYLKKTNHDVYFISRGEKLDKFKNEGIFLKSILGDLSFKNIMIAEDFSGIIFDMIMLTVKLYDFDDALIKISKNVNDETILLPFQNGIYAEEQIKYLFNNNVFGAVAQISAHLDSQYQIIHNGKLATFFVGGVINNNQIEKLKSFTDDCQSVGLDLRFSNKIEEKLWDKFIFLSAYSGLTTMTQMTIGEIFENKKYKKMFIDAMQETYKLSVLYDITFMNDPTEIWQEKIKNMPYNLTSSMFLDFKNKKKLELKWLSGFVVENLEKFGKESKVHKKIIKNIGI